MSESNENDEEKSAFDYIKSHFSGVGHIYTLVVLFVFTIVSRLQGYQSLRTDGNWLLVSNDAWYHFRATMYSVENYPSQIIFDAKTGYPEGATPGAFGTLYDFVHASIAMIIGLGDPSVETVRAVLVFSSPVLSALTVIAVYFMVKYITDSKLMGVVGGSILAFLPGVFYSRGVAGFGQHHIAEALLLISALFFVMKVVEKAESDLILAEVVREGNMEEIGGWLKLMVGALVFILMYYLTWPPAIMLIGLIGIAGVLYGLAGFSEKHAQPGLFTFVVLTGGMFVMTLVVLPSMDFSVASPSILHVAIAGSSFAFNVLAWIGLRYADRENWDFNYYAGLILGTGLIVTVLALIIQPSVISKLGSSVGRLLGFTSSGVGTIGEEAVPSLDRLIFREYGFMLFAAISGMSFLAARAVKNRSEGEPFGSDVVFSTVAIFIFLISIRTVRYNYYLAPFVAIMASAIILQLIKFVDIPESIREVQGYHVIAFLLLISMFAPVLLFPMGGGSTVYDPAVTGASTGNYGQWSEPLEWLSDNSPEDGVEQYEVNKQPYTYPNESYGVMSWWDYGHWITVTGERTPVANPFQQNAPDAAQYLLAQNPDEAESVVEGMRNGDHEPNVRYIAIDWQMASPLSKFSAMEAWHPDREQGDMYNAYYTSTPGSRPQIQFTQRSQDYYESMLGRLYVGHGSAMEASDVTINYNTQQSIRTIQPSTQPIVQHNSTEEAREFANSQTQVSRGGIVGPRERVEALDQYRLVKTTPARSFQTREYGFELSNIQSAGNIGLGDLINDNPSTVKLFEHVDGADISGSGAEPNSTLTLEVPVSDPVLGENRTTEFTYTQRVQVNEDGEFEATVPYSNTGYDEVDNAPEVRGSSQYRVIDSEGEVVEEFDVSEVDVSEDTDPIQVTVDDSSSE